ncbi:MAG: hypothetical protein AB7I52_17440 [Rhizobiaceae bacterium]
MSAPLIIEICPHEPRASMCLANGESVRGSDHERDVLDCTGSGDAEPACSYVRDHIGVEFRIVARNAAGNYENRLATAEEKAATCRAIYFESETDFEDERWADLYLIWQAARDVEHESTDAA